MVLAYLNSSIKAGATSFWIFSFNLDVITGLLTYQKS